MLSTHRKNQRRLTFYVNHEIYRAVTDYALTKDISVSQAGEKLLTKAFLKGSSALFLENKETIPENNKEPLEPTEQPKPKTSYSGVPFGYSENEVIRRPIPEDYVPASLEESESTEENKNSLLDSYKRLHRVI